MPSHLHMHAYDAKTRSLTLILRVKGSINSDVVTVINMGN